MDQLELAIFNSKLLVYQKVAGECRAFLWVRYGAMDFFEQNWLKMIEVL